MHEVLKSAHTLQWPAPRSRASPYSLVAATQMRFDAPVTKRFLQTLPLPALLWSSALAALKKTSAHCTHQGLEQSEDTVPPELDVHHGQIVITRLSKKSGVACGKASCIRDLAASS